MASVITFWQLSEDEQEFLNFLQGTGTIMAMPDHWVNTKEELSPQPIEKFIKQNDPDQFVFGLERHVRETKIEDNIVTSGPHFGLSLMESCLFAYRRGRLCNGKLALSNLCVYWKYPNAEKTCFIEKDTEFIKWAKKVLSWVRKTTQEQLELNGFLYRATNRVKKYVDENRISLVAY